MFFVACSPPFTERWNSKRLNNESDSLRLMNIIQSSVKALGTYLVGTHREIEEYFGEKTSRSTLYTNLLLITAIITMGLFLFGASYRHSLLLFILGGVLALDLFSRWPLVIDDTLHTSGIYSVMNGRIPNIESGFTRLGGDGIVGKCRRIRSNVRNKK